MYRQNSSAKRITTIHLTTAALFMALNIAFSSFGIPVPGGHLYLCDVVICLAGMLLNPFEAFLVGGVGSFLGDLIFYPLPMFVSLVVHGLQAVAVSLFSHYVLRSKPKLASALGVTAGTVIMVTGYTLGKAFIYSTPAYAVMGIPYELAQASLGAVLSMLLFWQCRIGKLFARITGYNSNKQEQTSSKEDRNV